MAAFVGDLPCGPFTTGENVLACCRAARDAEMEDDDIRIEDAIESASLVMYYATGRTYGLCTSDRIRPCVTGNCVHRCGCGVNGLNTGLWPVVSLESIWIEGAEGDTDDFHIDEWRYLVPNDPEYSWPVGNSMVHVADSEEEVADPLHKVFEIVVQYGIPAPKLIERATRALACEFLQDCLDLPCKLPERVTSQSRAGLSRQMASSQDLLRDGLTGIYAVDLAIKVLNPSGLQSPSFVISPDIRQGGRRTHT
jgi:hypothetical protein